MKSIRGNLVLWLLSALAFGGAILMVGTYVFTRAAIGRALDDEMRQIAFAIHLREDWVEAPRVRIARPEFEFAVRAYGPDGRVFFETLLPTLRFAGLQSQSEGYADVDTASGAWRVYTHVTQEGTVQVAQPAATRAELARSLAFRILLPVLLFIPAFWLLIRWVLARSLVPLDETSLSVARRDASRLDPLATEGVPRELAPLVDQINALMGRLAESLAAQRRFVADAAHELRSPVAALALQTQLAECAADPVTRAAAFAELRRGVERAGRMVQQLLALARLEPGEQPEPFTPVDLAALAREVVASHCAEADACGIDLGADAQHPAIVDGAREALRSLIANLVDNALRYAPRGSDVTVAVTPAGGSVELAVIDHGVGIPPAARERVFERFSRLANDSTPGSGLGLAIVKAVVARHGGTIALEHAGIDPAFPGLLVRVRLPAATGRRPGPEAD